MLIQLDHDGLEIRIQAHLYAGYGDTKWAEVFDFQEKWRKKHPGYPVGKDWNPRCDVYSITGSDVFGIKLAEISSKEHPIRERSKPLTLGMSYGLTEYGLAWRIKTDIETAKRHIARLFQTVPGMREYYRETREELISTEEIETMFGLIRRLPFKEHQGPNRKWAFRRAFRQAVNVKIQGPGSDLTLSGIADFEEKYTGLDILRKRNFGCLLVAEVHDAGAYDMKTTTLLKDLKWHMEHPGILQDYGIQLRVPLFVDEKRGNDWSFAKEGK